MLQPADFTMLHVAQAILRTAGVCLLLMLIGASCHMTSNETRDAYRRVKAKLLSHPYAVDKIPPKTLSGENINILIGFSPQQASFNIIPFIAES